MKKIFILSLLLLNFILSAQNSSEKDSIEIWRLLQLKAEPPRIGVDFRIQAATDDISMKHLWILGIHDVLENEDKDELLQSLIHESRLGYSQEFRLFYERPSFPTLEGKIRKGYSISYQNSIFTSVVFPRNAAQLFLYGNKPYEDEVLDLSGTNFEDWWYSSLDYKHIFRDDSIHISFNSGVVLGHTYRQLQMDKGEIYTAPNGEYLDMDLNYRIRQSSENTILPGMGLKFGGETELPINKIYRLNLAIEDLGLVYWSHMSVNTLDSNFRFQGLSFNNIFEINDSLIARERDKVENGFFGDKNEGDWTILPWMISGSLIRKSDHLNVENFYGSISYRNLRAYVPRLAVGINFRLNGSETQKVKTELAYGGFNTIALGAYYSNKFGEHFYVRAGSSNFLALILPSVATGSSLSVSCHYIF